MNEFTPIVVQDASTSAILMIGVGNEETQAISQKTGNVTLWAVSRNIPFIKGKFSGDVFQIVTTQVVENTLSDGILGKNSVVYRVNQILGFSGSMKEIIFTEQEFPNIFSEGSLIADSQNFLIGGISRRSFEVLANKRIGELEEQDRKLDELYRSGGMGRPGIMDGAPQLAPDIRAEVNRLLLLADIQE